MTHALRTTLAAAILLCTVGVAGAAPSQRTWSYLTTGNGHGFSVFDANQNKIVSFLEHPYRYLKPRPDPRSDGYGRRNLAFDFYFGVRGAGSSGWLNQPTQAGEPSYVAESNLIKVPAALGAIQAESTFFSPFGYEGNALIAVLKAPGATDGFALFNFHMGGGSPDSPDANGESLRASGQAVVETGPGGGALVYVPLGAIDHADCSGVFDKVKNNAELGDNSACSGNDMVPAFQKKLGSDGMMAVAVVFVENAGDADAAVQSIQSWANGRAPQQLLDDALAEWEAWRKPPPDDILCSEDERKLWRMSETVLRMGQVREVNNATRKNHGMILASLPPGEWHSGWVRDATYATVALARAGHIEEAKKSLEFFLNAGPVGKFKSYVSGANYQISVVRYFGNGEEEADYSGQQTPNVEFDGWGLFLWAVRQYVEASGDTAWLQSHWSALISGVADPLTANMEGNGLAKADSSIWEVHDANKKHFAYTTIASMRGFCDLAAMANRLQKPADLMTYGQQAEKTRAALFSVLIDQNGGLAGSLEELSQGRYLDAAVAEAFTLNAIIDFASSTAKATLQLFDQLRVDSGGFKRNDDGLSSYDNNEWILVDLRIADSLRRAGHATEANGFIAQIVQKAAANFYLLPELYNAVKSDGQVGKYAGAIPMVGYGGGAYLMTILDRAGLVEPNDCGDGKGATLPMLTCSGGGNGDGGIIGGGADGGTDIPQDIPYAPACYCDLGARQLATPSSSHWPPALILFLIPGVLLAWRLLRRRRA